MKIELSQLLAQLPLPSTEKWPEGVWDAEAFAQEDLSLILFTPRGQDYQTFHEQDELYIVVQGQGELVIEDARFPFAPGDVLFVPALRTHRFENFTDDLITWAIFWGPKGGTAGE